MDKDKQKNNSEIRQEFSKASIASLIFALMSFIPIVTIFMTIPAILLGIVGIYNCSHKSLKGKLLAEIAISLILIQFFIGLIWIILLIRTHFLQNYPLENSGKNVV